MNLVEYYPQSEKLFVYKKNIYEFVKENVRCLYHLLILDVQCGFKPPVIFIDRPGFVKKRNINHRQGITRVLTEEEPLYSGRRLILNKLMTPDYFKQEHYKKSKGIFFTAVNNGIIDGAKKLVSDAEKEKIENIGRLRINYNWDGIRKKRTQKVGGDVIFNSSNIEELHQYINELPPDLGSLWVYAVDDTARYGHQQNKDSVTRKETSIKVLNLVEKLQGITYEQSIIERQNNPLLK